MNEKDLTNYIKLDSVKNDESSDEETNESDQIGQHGIGSMKARARFCGRNGKEITTSVSTEGENYQLTVNMEKLLDKDATPEDCWTGCSVYRPKWIICENIDGYKPGVTTRYENPTSHNFDINELAQ